MAQSALLLGVVTALGTDRVDLVDLARTGAQVRFRAAAEGRVLYAAAEGAFERFWLEAVSFRCDAEPVIRAGYAGVLASLTRGVPSTATSSRRGRWSSVVTWPVWPNGFLPIPRGSGRRRMSRTS